MHRSVLAGTTMEVDFGESWVDIAGVPCKVKYLVATLPTHHAEILLLEGHSYRRREAELSQQERNRQRPRRRDAAK